MKFCRSCIVFVLILLLLACFAGCQEAPAPTTAPLKQLSLVAESAADLEQLADHPALEAVDLSGSSCYEAIVQYALENPQVQVTYDVALGDTRFDSQTTEVSLETGAYEFEQLRSDLQYLPKLTKLTLADTTLSGGQLKQLQEAYPAIALEYTVSLLGQSYTSDTTSLDLSSADPAQLEQITDTASALTKLGDVYLMKADGSSAFGKSDVKKLMDSMPGVTVHYSFELFGKTITTADERVEYVCVDIGNEGVPEIREALDILPKCTYFKLDRCGIDDLTMEKLRDDYPEKKIVWRIFFAFYNCLTDTEVLRCIRSLNDENVVPLKYCTDVKYMDFGHNEGLKNFDFLNYMPKLEIVIVVDSAIDTLDYFAKCENLQWLEIVNCQRLTDLSPLANCKNLKGVNIAANPKLKDVSPLYDLDQMERLFLGDKGLPKEQLEEIRANLPNTWVTQARRSTEMVSYNYSYGWRLNQDGERADWYLFVREIFRYDDNYFNHYNNDGQ